MNKKQTSSGGIIAAIVIIACIIGLIVSRGAAPKVFSILRWALIIVVILIAFFVALIIFIARKATKKDEKEKKESPTSTSSNMAHLDPEQSETIRKGREDLLEVRMLSSRIKNFDIRSSLTNVTKTAEKILVTIKERPDKIASSRQFTHYYLPTLREVITKYARVEASGVSTDDMPEKITSYLANVQKALDKQYSNLFDDDKLDMTVDMEAMTIAIKRDGLLDEDDFKKMEAAKEEAEKPVPEPDASAPNFTMPGFEEPPKATEPEIVERIEGEILDSNGQPIEEVIATAVKKDNSVH